MSGEFDSRIGMLDRHTASLLLEMHLYVDASMVSPSLICTSKCLRDPSDHPCI